MFLTLDFKILSRNIEQYIDNMHIEYNQIYIFNLVKYVNWLK